MTALLLPEPSDSDLQRLWDQLRAQRDPPHPVLYARAVLRRWGVQITWMPADPIKPLTDPEAEKPMTNPCDPAQQQTRQARLDELYARDGRHEPSHELHGLYTGLAEKYMKQDSTPATNTRP